MDNIGLLLHKLTKYQTLLANVSDSQKQEVYRQKIAFYNNKMTQIGIEQQNLNSLNNLVGGEPDKQIVEKVQSIKNSLLEQLTKTPTDKSENDNRKSIDQQIKDADKTIDNINKNYNNIIETLKKVIDEITGIEIKQTQTGKCMSLSDIVTKLKKLNTKLSTIQTTQDKKLTALHSHSDKHEGLSTQKSRTGTTLGKTEELAMRTTKETQLEQDDSSIRETSFQ
jgi:hypothetical protein